MTESSVKFGGRYLWGKIKSLIQYFCKWSIPVLVPKIYVSFRSFFMTHLSDYDNIFETET